MATVVSCYYRIASKHSYEKYDAWIRNFMSIHMNTVLFVDEDSHSYLSNLYPETQTRKYIIRPFESFTTSKLSWESDETIDHERRVGHNRKLYMVWNEKPFFMLEALKMNPYCSEYYMWVDMGCFRSEGMKFPGFPSVSKANLSKIQFLNIEPFSTSEYVNPFMIDERFRYVNRIGGTMFMCPKLLIEKFADVHLGLLRDFQTKGLFKGKDQSLYAFAVLQNPNMFELIIPSSYVGYNKWFYFHEHFSCKLAICAVFKNESHILNEWLQHYFVRGVDHIYLVNDNSTDTYLDIVKTYGNKITLYHNDINTRDVGRQVQIYEKYFRPILQNSEWITILDLDEFLYSPEGKTYTKVLESYSNYSQIKVDWLHFGSNGHLKQPISVINSFTKRAPIDRSKPYYSYKSIFRGNSLVLFNIHSNTVNGNTLHLEYSDSKLPPLVINHYNIQSLEYFMTVKATRGDINNWFDHVKLKRDKEFFDGYDINTITDVRLFEQNKLLNISNNILDTSNDVTLVITSCNRPELLDRTLDSFVKMNTYPIKATYIIDDSGKIGCNDTVVSKYRDVLNIQLLYNRENIGQTESIDKVYSYVRTKYIFHCEEDWVFLKPEFIEKSMKVFQENPSEKIYTVWLRPHSSTSGHPIIMD